MAKIDLLLLENFMDGFGKRYLTEEQFNRFLAQSKNGYVMTEKWLGKLCKKGDAYYLLIFSSAFEVIEKTIDVDTQNVRIRLKYYNGDKTTEDTFSSNILSKNEIKELYKRGIRFYESNVQKLTDYITESDSRAPIRYEFSKLGFANNYFKGFKTFGADEQMQYSGDIDIISKGSLEVWKSMVEKNVLNSVPLTFILCCGFASPVLQYLNFKNDLGAILFNIENKSSTGKSTSEMLAVSVFSNPVMNNGTLISFNGTESSISDFISNCQGFTVGLDEYGMNMLKNPMQFLYTICSGRSKMRLNSQAEQRGVKKYSSIILSSAEFSMLENVYDGIRARVFEIKDVLTTSAEQSDDIKHTVIENYAVAGEPFIEYLLTKLDNIQKDYELEISKLSAMAKEIHSLTKRIFSKFAVIILTAEYVKKALNLNIDIDLLREYAVKLEGEISNEKTTPEEHFLEVVQEEVMQHASKYSFNEPGTPEKGYGIIMRENGYFEYYITKPVLKRIIADNNILNYKTILANLKKDNILICEEDRKTIRMVVVYGMKRQPCYGFRIPDDSLPDFDDTSDEIGQINTTSRIISSKNKNKKEVITLEDFKKYDDEILSNIELY